MPRDDHRTTTSIILALLVCGLGLIGAFKLFPDYQAIGFVITVVCTTLVLLDGFDGPVTRFDFLPFFEMSYKAVPIAAVIVAIRVLVGALIMRNPFLVIATLFGAFYTVIIAIPTCVAYVAIRKRIRPVITDTFVRCRQCEYRVDNLVGCRCPECGTAVYENEEAQS